MKFLIYTDPLETVFIINNMPCTLNASWWMLQCACMKLQNYDNMYKLNTAAVNRPIKLFQHKLLRLTQFNFKHLFDIRCNKLHSCNKPFMLIRHCLHTIHVDSNTFSPVNFILVKKSFITSNRAFAVMCNL